MEFCSRCGVVAAVLIAISIVRQSDGRELRPSEHGLTYQDTPPATGENSADMMSFFGGPAASKVPLPEARNMSDTSSWRNSDGGGGGRRGDGGGDHVSEVLLVASVACGATGVVLLVVAAFVFLFRNQKQNRKEKSATPLALPPPPPVLALEDKKTTIKNTDAS